MSSSTPRRQSPGALRLAVTLAIGATVFAGGASAAPPPDLSGFGLQGAKSAALRPFYVLHGRGAAAAAEAAARGLGGHVSHRFPRVDAFSVLLPEAAVQALAGRAEVRLVEPVPEHRLLAQTVPWNIDQFQARELWDADRDGVVDAGAIDGSGLRICVIDSGIHASHSDFVGVAISGETEGSVGTWNTDGSGHGTHVAGTINAMSNDRGVVGVLPGGAELHIVKVFNDSGSWGGGSLAAAADKCQAAGAHVISMSLGGGASAAEEAVFQDLYDNFGILNVAAAGNDGVNTHSYPASYESVVSVGAIDKGMTAANFSQTPFSAYDPASPPADVEWDGVELAGGGVGVLSTVPTPDAEAPIYRITVDGVVHEGAVIAEAGLGTADGPVVDGGRCLPTDPVADWSGDVVLCERGDVAFSDKINTARDRGAVGVVIYNNEPADIAPTCGGGCTTPLIPAVWLTQAQGQALVASLAGQSGTVLADDGASCVGCEGGYDYFSGTSMATPGVSAAMALVWNACGGPGALTNKQVRQLLRDTALDLQGVQPVKVQDPSDPFDPPEDGTTPIAYGAGYDRVTGWGLPQLADALALGNALYGSTCPIGLDVDPPAAEVCGLDGSTSFTITLDEQFAGSATLSDGGTAPAGSSGGFSPNPVVHPGNASTYTLSGLENVASGIHALTFTATDDADPGNASEGAANISLFAGAPPSVPLLAPAGGATDVDIHPTFSWTGSAEASSYLLEVSTSADFSTLVLSASVAGTSHEPAAALAPNTTYHWRVRAENACGDTASAVSSFTTANVVCTVVPSTDVPKAIADATGNPNGPTPAVTVSTLTSAVSGTLVDVDVVGLNGTHTYIGDLSFDLRSPASSTVRIMASSCTGADNFSLGLDDEAAGSAGGWPCPPVGGGTYRPSNPLSAFDGQAANGSWSLRITDSGKNDTGTLQGWGLRLCVVAPTSNTPPVANADNYAATEDTALVVPAPGVLGNDTDAQSQPLSAALVSGVANGALSLSANGGFTYTPSAGFCGSDSFVYRTNDGQANSGDATVTLAVACVDDGAAVANDDAATVSEDSGANAVNVLGNDVADPDDDSLAVTAVGSAANGTTAFTAAGVTYTPDADFCGSDSFGYTVNGGDTATVSVTVACANDAPEAIGTLADQFAVEGDEVAYATAAAFSDRDAGDVLAFTASGLPSGLSMDPASGAISGTLAHGTALAGPYLVTVTASDGEASAALQFTLNVLAGGPVPSEIFRDGFED